MHQHPKLVRLRCGLAQIVRALQAKPGVGFHEPEPPEGQEPVSWLLATNRPIDSVEEVEEVIDAYRARWLVEEWLKAMKSGCAYEDRQLESLDTLLVAFALLTPIACRLLALRWLGRNEPARPASDVLDEDELRLLSIVDSQGKRKFPKRPTIRDAMFAVARMGGFLTQNKEPGWQTIGRGYIRLHDMLIGWRAQLLAAEEM